MLKTRPLRQRHDRHDDGDQNADSALIVPIGRADALHNNGASFVLRPQ